MNRISLLFVLSVVSLSVFTGSAARTDALVSWQPIKNLSDPHVQDIARFAVSEYNKQAQKDLRFEAVTKGEVQVVKGRNYRLTVNVRDGTETVAYEAIVWEKPWLHFTKLTSFKKA